jgi:hypothetical protein
MVGDERVRYCPDCKLDVYNFSTMSDEDVERIVSRREQQLCARVRQRPDGTVMTRNSSVSFSVVMQRISRAASIALAAAISVAPAMAGPPRRTPGQISISSRRPQWRGDSEGPGNHCERKD